ncbi:hypothetical protein E5161_09155 [Cohnella pontilimi]|uniref:NHL repeat-containing protein n=1 Tax=Cohnella pontilimi TaxID=2564100 RepID=A0A4U0FBZ6_9BACL|nr:NHL repeat-containing protein [Cohnella pontilimi]TJY42168.1 hypothetical protein E5161_09155 [Cohnella pontilimi]
MKKTIRTLLLASLSLTLMLLALPVSAKSPYPGYVYDPNQRTPASVNGYQYSDSIDGYQLPTGPFDTIEDLFVADDDTIYIVDSGNNRIVRIDKNKNVLLTFGDQEGKGLLNTPKGVFVAKNGEIYVADTGNRRIVHYDAKGSFIQEFLKPDSPLLGKDFIFSPSKVVVDKRGYLFVVSEGASQGLLQISPEGRFAGFFGANHLKWSLGRFLVKLIATKEQKDQMASEKPPEFSNLFEDTEGFYYTTSVGIHINQVKRLSTVGVDILNGDGEGGSKEENTYGDYDLPTINYTPAFESFVDVTVSPDGLITALDSVTGKVFQYNQIKTMLFVFGGIGDQNGLFQAPSSIAETQDGTIYVADKGRNRIDRFKTTPFGDKVHEASLLHTDGRYLQALPIWKEVLRMNANYTFGYSGIGMALVKQENYLEAMRYFKLGKDKYGYSDALARYRKVFLRQHFGQIAFGVIGLYLAWKIGRFMYRKKKTGERKLHGKAAKEGLNG